MIKQQNNKTIALFDFDGTITTGDSLTAFLRFNFGIARCIYAGIFYAPVHLLYKLKIVSSTTAKNFLLPFFLKNITTSEFERICKSFCRNKLPAMIYAKAIDKIKWHQQQQHKVVIVSASAHNWIEPWAATLGIKKIIATNLEVIDDKLTGKLAGKNCNHQEKVIRIKKEIPNIEEYEVYAYGNSASDRFMLLMADKKFYKKFE